MRPLVKICGNKDPNSSRIVARAAPDVMGWIFSTHSKRRVAPEEARAQIEPLSEAFPRIGHWGVFAGNSIEEIASVVAAIPQLRAVQVVEGPSFCRELRGRLPSGVELVPAIRVSSELKDRQLEAFGPVRLFVLDAFVEGEYGGTGKSLDPKLIARVQRPFLLAGGLTADNVARMIALAPGALAGVDVSSGVERGVPGTKDPKKVQRFIKAARLAFKE